jgi:hypothetical protein
MFLLSASAHLGMNAQNRDPNPDMQICSAGHQCENHDTHKHTTQDTKHIDETEGTKTVSQKN